MTGKTLKIAAYGAILAALCSCAMTDRQAGHAKAVCELASVDQANSLLTGKLTFVQQSDAVVIEGEISGLKPGKHGIHIHEGNDCGGGGAKNAGGHFNPTQHAHGAGPSQNSHEGDLGNIVANLDGQAKVSIRHLWLTLSGPKSVVGKSLVVHDLEDDLSSQPAGNSGARIACGVIRAE